MGSDGGAEKSPRWGSSAAQVIASNEDLLTELLLHLPGKSLLKFKCVCKQWLSLISHHRFTHRKSLKCNTISALYVKCWSPENGAYFEFVPLHPSQERATLNKDVIFAADPDDMKILHLCNGLLCYRVGEDKYLVYNTTTKQFKTLPPFRPLRAAGKRVVRFNLAFDPPKSHFYKVICILFPMSWYDDCQILIYSSETGRWSVSGASFSASLAVPLSSSRSRDGSDVYCNGAMHWLQKRDTSLYFDLNEEVIQEMPMPPFSHLCPIEYFGESGGHVYLVERSTAGFAVFEMEIDRSGWFVKFQVDLSEFAKSLPPYCCVSPFPFEVLHVVSREKDEDSFIVMHQSKGKIICHNFIRQTHQEILSIIPSWRWPIVYPYIETLSLV